MKTIKEIAIENKITNIDICKRSVYHNDYYSSYNNRFPYIIILSNADNRINILTHRKLRSIDLLEFMDDLVIEDLYHEILILK